LLEPSTGQVESLQLNLIWLCELPSPLLLLFPSLRNKALFPAKKLKEGDPPTVFYQKTLTVHIREQSTEK
jgi:hypothetical protein